MQNASMPKSFAMKSPRSAMQKSTEDLAEVIEVLMHFS